MFHFRKYKNVLLERIFFFFGAWTQKWPWLLHLLPLVFSSYIIYHYFCHGIFMFAIPDFVVSVTILNIVDTSHGSCRLNFGPLQKQVKLHHFPERIDAKRQSFYFLYKFLGIIGRKWLRQPLNELRLDLGNFRWIPKMAFHTPHTPHFWPKEIELAKHD